jgi:hypothetical protein
LVPLGDEHHSVRGFFVYIFQVDDLFAQFFGSLISSHAEEKVCEHNHNNIGSKGFETASFRLVLSPLLLNRSYSIIRFGGSVR